MIKNLLETKQGKYIFLVTVLLIVIIFGVLVILFRNDKLETTDTSFVEEYVSSEQQNEIKRGTVYAGIWYSNREDEMIVELLDNGTFRASTWLSQGSYHFNNNNKQIILMDDIMGEIYFNLQTKLGRTIMQTVFEEKEIFLYPDKELMKKELEITDYQDIVVENLVYQKWIDVLKQGNWEKHSSEVKYTLNFFDGKYVQQKQVGDFEAEVHEEKFVIVSQEVEDDSCLFIISLIGESKKDIQFRVTENELVYELTSTPGSFMWQSRFEVLVSSIELTQDGAQKIDAEKIDINGE
ncbi:hypothetical protein G8C15_17340 [Enterococcus casseliflavus]|nr:hypothetical protein [Enterococcus casseliflavus]MBF0015423.1 hypothetical protein [Enterococcus casseliflavus]